MTSAFGVQGIDTWATITEQSNRRKPPFLFRPCPIWFDAVFRTDSVRDKRRLAMALDLSKVGDRKNSRRSANRTGNAYAPDASLAFVPRSAVMAERGLRAPMTKTPENTGSRR